jgi:putative SOS response-associated peptidase YedK
MCGRYSITTAPEAMRALFRYGEQPNFPPRYNIAPTQPVPIVRLVEGQRQFALVRWGLIPPWVKDPKTFSLLINARCESVLDKPAFRNAMRRRRCLFPADGFYEWKRVGDRKRPYYVRLRSHTPMAFAGLWETWTGPNGEEMETAAIITTPANRVLNPIHDRMPAVLSLDAFDFWLDSGRVDALTAAALLVPARDDLFEFHEISTAVNRVANDSPALIAPVAPTEAASPQAQAVGTAPARRPKKTSEQGSLF